MKLECWHGTQSLVRFLLGHALMSTVSQSVICPHGICRRVLLVFPGSIITSKCAGLEHNRKGLESAPESERHPQLQFSQIV
jgi:hypothetical protein